MNRIPELACIHTRAGQAQCLAGAVCARSPEHLVGAEQCAEPVAPP